MSVSEQAVDSRLLMARMIAEQWFGYFMRPKTAADAWLVEGLAGWLEEKFILKYMGRNELEYRCPHLHPSCSLSSPALHQQPRMRFHFAGIRLPSVARQQQSTAVHACCALPL